MDKDYEQKNIKIHPTAIVYPNVVLHENVVVGPYCILGEPTIGYYRDENHEFKPTEIGANSIIRSNTIIYEGVKIGENFQTGHHVTIRENSNIGDNCSVGTLSDLQGRMNIGNYVRIHSNVFVCEFTEIKDYVWIFPHVVITNDPYPPVGTMIGCKIDEFAIIAAGSLLLPGVHIGKNALVAAGAIVSKDVSDEEMVIGTAAKTRGNVQEIRDKYGNQMYPWKKYMKEFRNYPWQVKK